MNDAGYRARITRKLSEAFAPAVLEVSDDSALHAGHAGYHPSGETHFRVTLVSPVFANMNRLERHREVYRVLAEELREHVHALKLVALAPAEHTYK